MKHVQIWTDGSCLRNPGGAGGWAAIIVCDGAVQEISGGVRSTTNNRMELMAAIMALKSLSHDSVVQIYTDASYLTNGYTVALARKMGIPRGGKWRKNPDLWNQLLAACGGHKLSFHRVRGHHGNPNNERADRLAGLAARVKKENLGCDEGYNETFVTKRGALVRLANNVDHAWSVTEHDKISRRYQQILNAPRIEQLILGCDADAADQNVKFEKRRFRLPDTGHSLERKWTSRA